VSLSMVPRQWRKKLGESNFQDRIRPKTDSELVP
jgi:hypothetical protein